MHILKAKNMPEARRRSMEGGVCVGCVSVCGGGEKENLDTIHLDD